jgi:hypothetical protein
MKHNKNVHRILIIGFLVISFLISCSRTASNDVISHQPREPTTTLQPQSTTPSILTIVNSPVVKNDRKESQPDTQEPIISLEATAPVIEYPVTLITISGPLTKPRAEISGMDWYEDYLILLPQYPERFGNSGNGVIFALPKEDIKSYIAMENTEPLRPIEIPFITSNLAGRIAGYEGFEAIAFQGNRAYLTIEARPNGMMGYVVAGIIKPDLSELHIDTNKIVEIPPQTKIANMSDESLLVFGNRLVSLYEANGANINQTPVAHTFDSALQSRELLAVPNIEYRVTDVTSPDDFGRFWAINYFYPGDKKLKPAQDDIVARFGEGPTHIKNTTVERLVEFQFSYEGILLADTPPIQLQLTDDQNSRNWEAIARLDDLGFLLATDKFPETIFAFISTTRP